MTSKENRIEVVFRVAGSASQIAVFATGVLGVDGRATLRPPAISVGTMPEAWWAFEVVREDQESTEPVIAQALATADANLEIRKAASNGLIIELDCTIEIDATRPVIEVSKESIRRLADLGASLGFEVHDYRE